MAPPIQANGSPGPRRFLPKLRTVTAKSPVQKLVFACFNKDAAPVHWSKLSNIESDCVASMRQVFRAVWAESLERGGFEHQNKKP
jgi:hypothetical protein